MKKGDPEISKPIQVWETVLYPCVRVEAEEGTIDASAHRSQCGATTAIVLLALERLPDVPDFVRR